MKTMAVTIQLVVLAMVVAAAGTEAAGADDYWSVRCNQFGYGIEFNIAARKAFIVLQSESGGTFPAASTDRIIRYVNAPNNKYAIFDFGSATQVGVNISRSDQAFIYRIVGGRTYRVCDAIVSVRTSDASDRKGRIALASRASSGTAQIFVLDADGGNRQQATTSSGDKYSPSLRSDGRRIAFHARRQGNNDIFVVDLVTGAEQQVTNHEEADLFPAFSPDGSKIAFISQRHGNRKNLFVINANGSGSPTRLTDTSQAVDGQPAWTPDGGEIAFVEGWGGSWEIKTVAVAGGSSRRLVSGADPDWSPDGAKLAYRTSQGAIWVMDRDGSGRRELVSGAGEFNAHPAWSPDGREIIFETSRHSTWGNSQLYFVDVASKQQVRLTENDLDDSTPDWCGP